MQCWKALAAAAVCAAQARAQFYSMSGPQSSLVDAGLANMRYRMNQQLLMMTQANPAQAQKQLAAIAPRGWAPSDLPGCPPGGASAPQVFCYPPEGPTLDGMMLVDVIYFDAGGGHRAAATALQLVCRQQQRPFEIRLVHLKEILAPVDVFRKVLRIDLEQIYNLILRRGWTLGSAQGLRFMQAVIRRYHAAEVRLLREWWEGRAATPAPDMVVSVVPNFNRALFEAWQAVKPAAPFVTLMTDLADYPPAFWIERQPQDFICGTEKARRQALEMGHAPGRVFLTSGMILHPRFYETLDVDVAAGRERLGLDPRLPTGLVLFGGYGSRAMESVLESVDKASADVQLILIAGRNEALRQKLERRRTRIRKYVLGFTGEVPYWMRLADFLIGKPGPGSVSEAVHCGLPVITVRNAWTLPQERYNAEWLIEHGAGLVTDSYRRAGQAVASLVGGGLLEPMRAATRRIRNRAVFEIPEILEQIGRRA